MVGVGAFGASVRRVVVEIISLVVFQASLLALPNWVQDDVFQCRK